jgi:Leucine-rich repeat (LRR) protein
VDSRLSAPNATLLAGVLRANTTLKGLSLDGVLETAPSQLKGVYRCEQSSEGEPFHHLAPPDSISLAERGLSSAVGIVLARLIELNTALTALDVRKNTFGVRCAGAFARCLERDCSALRSLHLSANPLCGVRHERGSYEPSGMLALATALALNTTLTCLHLAAVQGDPSSSMGPEVGLALATALALNTTLTELSLQQNVHLGAEALGALAKALTLNTTLRSLNLASTRLGMVGYKPLLACLRSGPSSLTNLTNLGLSSNGLGSKGGVALAAALEGNTSLRRLDLASNEIGAEGGTRLAKLLELSTALSRLDLRSNDLRACIGAFQAALEVRGGKVDLRI